MSTLSRVLLGLGVLVLLVALARLAAPGIFDTVSADDPDTMQQPPGTSTESAQPKATEATPPAQPSTTIHEPEAGSGEIITGSACPCTVTGYATLQGEVLLQGDLVVDGGTLIARPGVDLYGNGHQIMFMNGGRADFQGTPVSTWSGDGSNGNLERDINLRDLRRIMFHGGAGPSVLKYLTVWDSGTSELGDYPLHWHLNGDTTRGTLVEGVVVVKGANHAFVPHGSHGITFKDTIAKDTVGHAYWWDPPGTNGCESRFRKFCTADNSNDITYDRALADGVTEPEDSKGFRLAGFMLGAGSGNVIRDSVAINISPTHVKDCAGFQWPGKANQNVGGNTWVFENNYSFSPSGCHGIFVWQNDGAEHIVDGFTGSGIDHGAYNNRYEYRDIDVPYVEVHASGWKVVGGRIGTVYTKKHVNESKPTVVFQDVEIGRFVIQNASRSGDIPGHYVLGDTGLSCDDIEYGSVVPGTKVVVDGKEC